MVPSDARQSQTRTFPGPTIFVWGVWAVLLVQTLVLIYQYHSCIPFGEDWCPYYWAAAGSSQSPRPIIADTIDRIRIYPNVAQAFRCKLVRVELLIPETPKEEPK